MYVSAIVVAAGKGARLKSGVSKPLVNINSNPVLIYSLRVLSSHPLIKEIVIVVNSSNAQSIAKKIRQCRIAKIKDAVLGGTKRSDSVSNGLSAIDERTDLVLIHDAARPFINKAILSKLISQAANTGAAILGVPVKATIKRVTRSQGHNVSSNFIVDKTIDRSNLWEIQTPQVFRRDLILKAYEKFKKLQVTDDAMLVEKLGVKVSVVRGSYDNIKVTTPEDLIIAQAIAKNI